MRFLFHVPLLNVYGLAALGPCFFALFCFFEGLQPIFGFGVSVFDLPPRQLGVMTKPTANCSIELHGAAAFLLLHVVYCLS